MTSRFPAVTATTISPHQAVILKWDLRGCARYRERMIKRVYRQRQGFEYRIIGTRTPFDELDAVLEEIDYLCDRMDDERIG